MAPKTPNYSFERFQRERAQRAKSEEKADRRAEKAARRKARAEETTAGADAGAEKAQGEKAEPDGQE